MIEHEGPVHRGEGDITCVEQAGPLGVGDGASGLLVDPRPRGHVVPTIHSTPSCAAALFWEFVMPSFAGSAASIDSQASSFASIGVTAAPDLSTAHAAITASTERASATGTRVPGPTPSAIRTRARRDDRSSNSPYVISVPSSAIAGASGSASTTADST